MSARVVLIVDDEPLVSRMFKRMLSRRGVHAETADGVGQAKILLAASMRFDVILSDIDMPDGTGFDVIAAAILTATRPRFVLMSAAVTDDKLECAKRLDVRLHDKGDFDAILADVIDDCEPKSRGA